MEIREEWILLAPNAKVALEAAVGRWLAQQPRPTAAICFHDGLEAWVLKRSGPCGHPLPGGYFADHPR